MELENKKVLVTGAGGFIGSHLVEKLLNLKTEVTCFVRYNSLSAWGFLDTFENRNELNIVAADLKDSDAVRKAVKGQDLVFHLGASISIPHSYDFPREHLQTNIMGTFNVLSASREFKVGKIVHVSSSEVYGTPKNCSY